MRIHVEDYTKGEIIRFIREWSGLSQREFGKMIGKSRTTVVRYELEDVNYSIETLLLIAKKLDLEIILQGKDKRQV